MLNDELSNLFDDEENLLDAARQNLREGHPNPDRIECPPAEAIRRLALHPLEGDLTLNLHLNMCSPCYRLYSKYLAEARAERRDRLAHAPPERQTARVVVVAGAAIVLIAGALLVSTLMKPHGPPERAAAPSASEMLPEILTADLRPYAPIRAVAPSPPRDLRVLRLPARPIRLKLLLPVGTEPGLYEVVLVGPAGETIWSRRANAEIIDHVTTLEVNGDFSRLPVGDCMLLLKMDGPILLRAPVFIGTGRRD
jgi:hypothetical protein